MTRTKLPQTDELRMRLDELDSVYRGLYRNMRLAAFRMREDFVDTYLDYLDLETKSKKPQNMSQRDMENLACLKEYVDDFVRGLNEKLVNTPKMSRDDAYFVDMFAKSREVSHLMDEGSHSDSDRELYNKIDVCLQSVYDKYPRMNDWENPYVTD